MSSVAASRGRILAICVGAGGIPKRPVPAARAHEGGIEGDSHRFHLHGGKNRAVSVFSVEDYRALERAGVPIGAPGTFGENLLMEGLDFRGLCPGDRLEVGETVVLEIFDVREPCGTLKQIDPRFPNLMVGRSGFVCSVRAGGELRPGLPVAHRPRSAPAPDAEPAPPTGPRGTCPVG